MAPPFPGSQGAPQNYKKLGAEEPGDHAIGKSRGGMTCKIHLATDGKGRPLGLVLTAGQAADTSFFQTVLETISVAGNSRGRPRMRPDRVLADKAYTSSANRGYLAGRGIKVTIPERSDQIAGRARRGSKGGRPDPSTRKPTKAEMSLSAASIGSNNGVASRPEVTKQHAATSLASRSPQP
jgi:transposase